MKIIIFKFRYIQNKKVDLFNSNYFYNLENILLFFFRIINILRSVWIFLYFKKDSNIIINKLIF